MKKRVLSLVISVCMVLACFSILPQSVLPYSAVLAASKATSGWCGENVTWVLKDHVLTISGKGPMYNSGFGFESPFQSNNDIYKVVIKQGVTLIGENNFSSCKNLKTVSLPESMSCISDGAFFGCYKLNSINLPDSIMFIGEGAFNCCTSLTSVHIPKSLIRIRPDTFFCCVNIKTIDIPYGVQRIEHSAFGSCNRLTDVTIPESVKWIDRCAFYTTSIKKVFVPQNAEVDGEAFGYNIGGKTNDLIIYCYKGSSAETYAKQNGFTYKNVPSAYYRLQGDNRYDTAVEISKKHRSSDYVILASGLNSADALAGVPLADAYGAPILLTAKDSITSNTLNEIKRLNAQTVIILGGTGAVSKNVENKVRGLGVSVDRIGGKTRFATSRLIAERIINVTGYYPTDIFFVNYTSFADALSVSTVAAIKGAPIMYVKKDGALDSETSAYLKKVKSSIGNAYVIGGTGVVSENVRTSYIKNTLGRTPTRVYGANRYDTCVAINERFASIFSSRVISVAKGLDFPDALSGGAIAAYVGSPLLLADNTLNAKQTNYIKNLKPNRIIVFGGHFAVTDGVVQKVSIAALG